jgi:hypothetical protein
VAAALEQLELVRGARMRGQTVLIPAPFPLPVSQASTVSAAATKRYLENDGGERRSQSITPG